MKFLRYGLLLCLLVTSAHALTITQAEYYINTDPGIGLATPITITPGENVTITGLMVSSDGLSAARVHRLFLRYQSDDGYWSMKDGRYFYIITSTNGSVTYDSVIQADYWFDNLAHDTIDVPDGTTSSYAALVPAAALTPERVHKFNTRFQDSRGIWSMPIAKYFYIIQEQSGTIEVRTITHIEYWFDSLPATQLDITDGTTVTFAELIPVDLIQGLHRFYIRYRDDTGVWSMADGRNFVLISQVPAAGSSSSIVAAEYFINADPGQGNGVPISLPVDSAWDEREEDTEITITGLPIGLHQFSIRYQDDQGIWSMVFSDTVVVTPVLVIKRSGDNILLIWQADSAHIPFHVYRSDTPVGGFTEIAQTDSLNYSDLGAVTAFPKKFYYVTTTPSALSAFRLPPVPEIRPADN